MTKSEFDKKYGKNFKTLIKRNVILDELKSIKDKLKRLLGMKTEFPTSIKVSNFPKDIIIPEFPDEIKIKKPNWLEVYNDKKLRKTLDSFKKDILKAIKPFDQTDILKAIENKKFNLDTYQDSKEALAVRLVTPDGINFYRASGSGTSDVKTVETLGSILTAIEASSAAPDQAKMTLTIKNLSMPTANTEYSYALPTNTKRFTLKLRAQNAKLKFAFVSGESGTNYIEIPQNDKWVSPDYNLDLDSKTIYMQSSKTGGNQIAEILIYT